ncbi:hypothetical protein BDD12DRAFT_880676 [Trichophaea hybrida]|nr:hypothetical protein BDD12DRAFT_880676 [Trichophaea hybrida]
MFANFPTVLTTAFTLWAAVAGGAPAPADNSKNKGTGDTITVGGNTVQGPGPSTDHTTSPVTTADPSLYIDGDAFHPSCWATLGMEDWINNWWAENNTKCGSLGFAQCFLQYNHYAGLTCDVINTDTCGPPDSGKAWWDSPQQFYTLWAIYSIHQFFTQYYNALGIAQCVALGKVGEIVLTIVPPHDSTIDGKKVSILISATFALFAIVKESIVGIEFKVIWIDITALTGGAAQFGNYLNDKGGQNNYHQEMLQMATIQNTLSDMVINYQDGLAKTITEVQQDVGKFLTVCHAGGFTQRITGSLPDQVKTILDQLKLFILGSTLSLNHAVIAKNPGISALDISHLTPRVQCGGYDGSGLCDHWYYDGHSTYTIENMDTPGGEHYASLNQKIFANGWATPQSFYKSDDGCATKGPYLDDNGNLRCAVRIPPTHKIKGLG